MVLKTLDWIRIRIGIQPKMLELDEMNADPQPWGKLNKISPCAGYNRVGVVEYLLNSGADVHAKDKGGLVPLHNACSYGHYEVPVPRTVFMRRQKIKWQ